MRTLTATDVARRFSRVLDSLEQGGEEILIVRNHQPVAKLVPVTPRPTAMETLADLYRTLDDATGEAWLANLARADCPVRGELKDPWA